MMLHKSGFLFWATLYFPRSFVTIFGRRSVAKVAIFFVSVTVN